MTEKVRGRVEGRDWDVTELSCEVERHSTVG